MVEVAERRAGEKKWCRHGRLSEKRGLAQSIL